MKRLFTAITFALLTAPAFSQTIGNIPLKDIKVDYVQIVGTSKLLSTKLTIEIDFGQETTYFKTGDTQLRDENGKKVVFNSMIDALNFMSENGYEFVNAYTITVSNQNVYHFILRRKK